VLDPDTPQCIHSFHASDDGDVVIFLGNPGDQLLQGILISITTQELRERRRRRRRRRRKDLPRSSVINLAFARRTLRLAQIDQPLRPTRRINCAPSRRLVEMQLLNRAVVTSLLHAAHPLRWRRVQIDGHPAQNVEADGYNVVQQLLGDFVGLQVPLAHQVVNWPWVGFVVEFAV
jgi:hypothetical protein